VYSSNFEQVINTNKEKIYRICRVYALSPIEPQDLFQEVAYQIWRSMESFEGKSNIDSWVYRIALNVCMRSKLKLEKRSKQTIRFDAIRFNQIEGTTDDNDDNRYRLLKQCINALNESDTTIILMYLEELSYKQIAEITGLTENHIAVKMKRIRKKLFDCITPKLI